MPSRSGNFVTTRLALVITCLLASGCAATQADVASLPTEPFSGHVVRTANGTWFTPCGAAESVRWWVTYVDASVRQAKTATDNGQLPLDQRAFVRWRASRTDDRLVGPGGPALLVRDIFEIRSPRPKRTTAEVPLSRTRHRSVRR